MIGFARLSCIVDIVHIDRGESGAGKTENTKKVIQYFAGVAAPIGAKISSEVSEELHPLNVTMGIKASYLLRKLHVLAYCWVNVGPASKTMGQQ